MAAFISPLFSRDLESAFFPTILASASSMPFTLSAKILCEHKSSATLILLNTEKNNFSIMFCSESKMAEMIYSTWYEVAQGRVQHDEGLARHRGMREHEATPVRTDSALQIEPISYRMNSLVVGDLSTMRNDKNKLIM